MDTQKPLKMGKKHGAMKVIKGGCMHCGNMEHTGCMCHMLGGAKQKKNHQTMEGMPHHVSNPTHKVRVGEGWLDDAFDWTTDKLVDLGSKAIGKYLPIPENLAKTGLKALQKEIKKPVVGVIERKLKGRGKPMSQKQQEYQDALELIKKKFKLNHKQAMTQYKLLKNNLH